MITTRDRALAAAHRWLKRADLNPHGELALVAKEFVIIAEQDIIDQRVVELPPWPFYSKAEAHV